MNDLGGVWRTVGGRRIFIKDGEDLATAMKNSGKFEKQKYNTKQEVNEKIKEINKKIYSENGVDKEEYEELKKQLDELKKIKKELPDAEERKNVLDDNFEISKKELEKKLVDIEKYEDDYGIQEQYLDEINAENMQKIVEMYEDGKIDSLEYENLVDNYNEQISSIMYEKGYEIYEHQGKIYYSMIPKAKESYDNIIKELDKKNVQYEISRSWNAGELPSIYIQDKDGNQFRISNHFNNKNQEFNKGSLKRNKIYSTKDYINYKETVLKDLEDFLKSNED